MPYIEFVERDELNGISCFDESFGVPHNKRNHRTAQSEKIGSPDEQFPETRDRDFSPSTEVTDTDGSPKKVICPGMYFQNNQPANAPIECRNNGRHETVEELGPSANERRSDRLGQAVFSARPLATRRTRKNNKTSLVGNNPTGRNGALRCSGCRSRKIKCFFSAIDAPCTRCQERGITVCIKVWGEKKEESLRRQLPIAILGIQLPTAIDSVIDPQYVPLLQFAYSDHFLYKGGSVMATLLRKFGAIFTPSINNDSLRYATLAWASAFSMDPSAYSWVIDHSISAGRALMSKNSKTIDDADLYASFLLCILWSYYRDSDQFTVHLRGFVAMMALLKEKTWGQAGAGDLSSTNHLSIFLPLGRDLILEMSRKLNDTNTLIIQFSNISRDLIGPASFHQRTQYHKEFLGPDPSQHRLFANNIWHHYTILRRCFRNTLFLQLEGRENSTLVRSLVSEIKEDLLSQREFVDQLLEEIQTPGFSVRNWATDQFILFSLFLHKFCHLMVQLLQAETIRQGAASAETVSLATSLLQQIQDRWLEPGNRDFLLEQPFGFNTIILVRVLCITGIILNQEKFPEASKIIICKLERTGEEHYARALERFWKDSDWKYLRQIWRMSYKTVPFPVVFHW